MDLLVVDTSAVLAVLLDEPERRAIIALTGGVQLMAAPSLHWELGNALVLKMRRQLLTLDQVRAVLDAFAAVPTRQGSVELADALDLAQRFGLYAYDAYALACAKRYAAPLLTLDRGQGQAARRAGIAVMEVRQ